MASLPMEEIEKQVGSRYALTVLAGMRARELRDGSPRLVNTDSNNPILIALQEIHEGKIVAEAVEPEAEAAQAEPTPAEIAEALLTEPAAEETLDAEASAEAVLAVSETQSAPAVAEDLQAETPASVDAEG